jgi:AcrR family transcriptional regulator
MSDFDRRQQILSAAMRVFAQHGFHKASIKQIAKEADIKSSALIYWYFKDKKELLLAVITEHSPLKNLPILNPALRESLMDVPPHELLPMMGKGFLSLQNDPDSLHMLRLYISEAIRTPEAAEAISGLQGEIMTFLVSYLRHHIEIGNLRPHNYESTARAFVGTWVVYLLARYSFVTVGEGLPDADSYIDDVIDAFLNGIGA